MEEYGDYFWGYDDTREQQIEKWECWLEEQEGIALPIYLDFCKNAEIMVNDVLTIQRKLLVHRKVELNSVLRMFGLRTKRYREQAALADNWSHNLPYVVLGAPCGLEGTVCHIVNREFLAPDKKEPGRYVRPSLHNPGFFLNLNDDDGWDSLANFGLWLYKEGEEPWRSPNHAVSYLQRLRCLIGLLEKRRDETQRGRRMFDVTVI